MIINHDKIDEYIKTLKAHKCPLCGNNEWTVSDTIFYAQELTQSLENGEIIIGGTTKYIPFITISCSRCGNTHIINTLSAGLHKYRESEVNKDGDK